MIHLFPKFGKDGQWIEVDAVMSVSVSSSVNYTHFPIEWGAEIADHGIIQPQKYSMQGGVCQSPLGAKLTDFAGGFFSNLFDNSRIANAAGLSAGFLAGTDEGRPAASWSLLYELMVEKQRLDIFNGLTLMKDMVITNLSFERNPKNESSLLFEAQLQELITIDHISRDGRVKASTSLEQTKAQDPVSTQNIGLKNQGSKTAGLVSLAASAIVTRLLV